ncbi:RagB/SusD family nutrient uptake outer membrane protein [uncultured Capnocytophaga sp.]|uniref:RagB/SusD family nutrient uptake outer membrane protein n=1 Tax=uncultured Capnocytophaga sp. TaxID=159273 RepID=UPI002593F75A|nr:RagB/SusD family nutrient uptake outer membrane protein [uncultured Capnocytophaga sp.]
MKRIYKHITFIGLLGALLSQISCKNDDFLDKYPPDAFNEKGYFNSDEDLKIFANRFYGGLPVQFFYNDNDSDNMAPKNMNSFLAGTYTIPATGGGWSINDWNGIYNCNFFLDNYNRSTGSKKEQYAAEVRFFRALYYWNKVKTFGDVPLILTKVNDASSIIFGPRVAHKQVMDKVMEDMNFAVQNLPEKAQAEVGRLHKDAALALKSRVALWEGTYRKYHTLGDESSWLQAAVEASESLINSGRYSVYTTGNPDKDYRNLFIQQDLSRNSEAIFHRTYIKGTGTHGYTRTAGENSTGCSKDFMESYLFTDGLPIGTTTFTYDDSTPAGEAANRDPRYAQTVATPGFVWTENSDPAKRQVVTLPAVGTGQTSTGYWLIKGRSSDPEQWIANQSDLDLFIFRYAEILLNFAEAKYELGSLSQADLDKTINKLRDRVAMPHLTTAVTADTHAINYGYTVTPLLYEIRRERRVELIGEGFRIDDIKRWKAGKLIENPKIIRGMKLNAALKAQYPANSGVSNLPVDSDNYLIIYPSITTGHHTWNDKLYLYPLPIDQIQLVKYTQNPGW